MLTTILTFLHKSTGTIFLISAIIGTVLFVTRMLFTFIGAAWSTDTIDTDHLESYANHHHDEVSVKMFTVHSIAGFLMTFGWIGFGCIEQYQYAVSKSLGVATFAGLAIMVITALLMKYATKLESHGTVFSNKKTINLIGTVYQQIPQNGEGKIQIVVDGITRELLAQSFDKSAIESFQLVKVVGTIDHEVVQVQAIKELHHD